MALTKLTTVGASQKTANLTTLDDSNDVVRVQATTSGAVVTGILTATTFDGAAFRNRSPTAKICLAYV